MGRAQGEGKLHAKFVSLARLRKGSDQQSDSATRTLINSHPLIFLAMADLCIRWRHVTEKLSAKRFKSVRI